MNGKLSSERNYAPFSSYNQPYRDKEEGNINKPRLRYQSRYFEGGRNNRRYKIRERHSNNSFTGRYIDHNYKQHVVGRGKESGNRFSNRKKIGSTKSMDQKNAMLKQLSTMVAKMGDIVLLSIEHSMPKAIDVNEEKNLITTNKKENDEQRVLIKTVAKNVQDLTAVLCSTSNAPLFLSYHKSKRGKKSQSVDKLYNNNGRIISENFTRSKVMHFNENVNNLIMAEDEAGILATLVTSCADTLPLQCPAYVALTLMVEECAPRNIPVILEHVSSNRTDINMDSVVPRVSETTMTNTTSYGGFAERCVTLACRKLGVDLDLLCGAKFSTHPSSHDHPMVSADIEESQPRSKLEQRSFGDSDEKYIRQLHIGNGNIDAFMRCKLRLRYLALLGRVGIILTEKSKASADIHHYEGSVKDDCENFYIRNCDKSLVEDKSIAGLLRILTECARHAAKATFCSPFSKDEAVKITYSNASVLLSILVLSTLPYVISYLSSVFCMELLTDIENILFGHGDDYQEGIYKSLFRPGGGISALLLEREQLEDLIVDVRDEVYMEEIDESEEEENCYQLCNSAPAVCADTLHDLLRSVRKILEMKCVPSKSERKFYCGSKTSTISYVTKFSLLTDAPWLCIPNKDVTLEESTHMKINDGKETNGYLDSDVTSHLVSPLSFKGKPLPILLPQNCLLLPYLLGLEYDFRGSNDKNNRDHCSLKAIVLQCHSLDGIVFGRLSIFDHAPQGVEEEKHDDSHYNSIGVVNNGQLNLYVKSFNLVDRYFLSECIRDCLICHRYCISDTGVEKGTIRDISEQIWSVSQLFPLSFAECNNEDVTSEENVWGFEYGVVETLLSLIIQAPRGVDSSISPLSHVYLSRVLLDLTKYRPSHIPRSVVAACGTLLQDCLPSLTSSARDNLSSWLAFHLTNTEYQWPHAYWNHWTPYVFNGMIQKNTERSDSLFTKKRKKNCRGEFIITTIKTMTMFMSSSEIIAAKCFPQGSPLCSYLYRDGLKANNVDCADNICNKPNDNEHTQYTPPLFSALQSVEKDLNNRIWKDSADPDTVREYMVGDVVSKSIQVTVDSDINSCLTLSYSLTTTDMIWWRTAIVLRSIFRPAIRDLTRIEHILKIPINIDKTLLRDTLNIMDDIDDNKTDVLENIEYSLYRYRPVLLATLAKDFQIHEEILELRGEDRKDEALMLVSGEIYILRLVESIVHFFPIVFHSCVEILLKHEIVSSIAVLQWVLGDNILDKSELFVIHGWWNFAISVVQNDTMKALAVNKNDDNIVDETESDKKIILDTAVDNGKEVNTEKNACLLRMRKVTDHIFPLMEYSCNRVRKLIETLCTKERKDLIPLEVDLREGLKYFIKSTIHHVAYQLKNDDFIMKANVSGGVNAEVENWLNKSKITFKIINDILMRYKVE